MVVELPYGVSDTFNPVTVVYTQRVGRVILCGDMSEKWITWGTGAFLADNFLAGRNSSPASQTQIKYKTNGFPTNIWNKIYGGETGLGTNGQYVGIKDNAKFTSVATLRSWLQTNPVTVWYELETPIITNAKPTITKPVPFSYENVHVVLESGHSGQSLIPTIDYSVLVSRTGQVNQNTKMLMKQNKQISDLEDLVLLQILETNYQNALLRFDFVMKQNKEGLE